MIEQYINVMHMVLAHYIMEYLRTSINEWHLGYTTHYEHVFMGLLVSNVSSIKITLTNI